MEEFLITLSGDFGFEIKYKEFALLLSKAAGKDLLIKITSDGGDVREAVSMRNELISYMKKYPQAKVTMEVIGWAQSAGSHFTTVPKTVTKVYRESMYMYHMPWTIEVGDYTDFLKTAEFLKNQTDTYARDYAAKSGIKEDEVLTAMAAETHLIGQAIVDAGFADELIDGEQDVAMNASELVHMSKKRFSRCHARFQATALGAKPDDGLTPIIQTTEIENKGDKMSTEDAKKLEEKRFDSYMKAVRMFPKQTDKLEASFKAGENEAYFRGLVSHAEMMATKDEIDDVETETGKIEDIETPSNDSLDATKKALASKRGARQKF